MALVPWRNKSRQNDGGQHLPLANFRDEMDRLFDSFFHEPFGRGALTWGEQWNPAMDVEEDEQGFVIRAEVPGLKPEEIDLSISENRLVLSGEKKETSEKNVAGCQQRECRYGSFRREIALPSSVDANDVRADCKDGVLTVHLKKVATAQPKRISVSSG